MPIYAISTEAEEALAAATAETVLLLAGVTSVKARIIEWGVSLDGTAATAAPVEVKIRRGNSASQGTSTAATEELMDPDAPTANATGFHSFTAEPTYTGQPLQYVNVHPQGGIFVWQASGDPEDGIVLDNTTSSFIGVECTAPATVNCVAWVRWKE